MAVLFARLVSIWYVYGTNAYVGIKRLLSRLAQINLLNLHSPFQIDGNFGETTTVTEMLIQLVVGKVVLLSVLPPKCADGKKAKGNLLRGKKVK